jgi:PAS domain S-box-containing protein
MNNKMTNILLVEDEESHADLICLSFESITEQMSVTVAYNLNEARHSIAKSTPDLIIADFLLPDGKGTELIPTDREESPYPVIILTSHGDEQVAVEAMKAGAFDYIVKSEAVLDDMPHICERIIREWNHIFKRKKAEEALSKSEEKYRKLVETAPDAIMCDINGIISDWNKSAERVFGYSKDEIIGKPVNILVPAKYKKKHQEGLEQFLKTGESGIIGKTVAVSGLTKEGVEIPIEISLTYQRLEQKQHLFTAIIRDITERKKIEAKLESQEELYHTLVETLPHVVWVGNAEGYITFLNKAWKEWTGRNIADSLGDKWMESLHPDDTDELLAKWERAYKSGEPYTGECRFKAKDGSYKVITFTGVPVRDASGKITSWIGIDIDITELKKMEVALLQSEKLQSLGTITAGVSHEFNNILAIISGNVQLLEGSRKDDKELMDALRTIKRATNDGAQISRRMLKFTKTAKDTTGFMPFDINELINQAIDFTMPRWKNMAQAKGISYHMDTEGMKRVPSILCNPTEIREVFVNIINNALDAMPYDGRISFSTWSKEDTVFISISDTGEGMSEEAKKKLFDPFFTTKTAVGTGLGMSTAYGIVNRHGGKLEVESEVGKGSIFTVQFPADTKADSPKESPETQQEIKSNSLRILVVDDEEEICNILDKFFSKKGHLVRTVDNGTEAKILTKVADYDLVLCDMAMPEVFGYDVIKALNKLEKRPKIGIITGWDEKFKSLDDEDLKVDFIIRKPFDFSELTRHINDVLSSG